MLVLRFSKILLYWDGGELSFFLTRFFFAVIPGKHCFLFFTSHSSYFFSLFLFLWSFLYLPSWWLFWWNKLAFFSPSSQRCEAIIGYKPSSSRDCVLGSFFFRHGRQTWWTICLNCGIEISWPTCFPTGRLFSCLIGVGSSTSQLRCQEDGRSFRQRPKGIAWGYASPPERSTSSNQHHRRYTQSGTHL